jgi:hypothetical protein
MSFLPPSYEAPKPTSQLYLRLQDGENRIRILSRPIFGWEDWSIDRKPIRYEMANKPAKPVDSSKPMKHFWAFIVWNVIEEQIQIMQITQATIRSSLESLSKDSDWGSPYEYDVKIIKKGEKMDTEYTVNPAPHKPVSQEILKAFAERPIQLEALFLNLDPFATGYTSYTPLMCDAHEEKIEVLMGERVEKMKEKVVDDLISDEQAIELSELLNGCSADSQVGFPKFLLEKYKVEKLYLLPKTAYKDVKDKLTKRYQENLK